MRGFIFVIFTKYHLGAQIKKGETGGRGGTHDRDEKWIQNFSHQKAKRPLRELGVDKSRILKRILKKEGVHWIRLSKVRGQWRALVNTVINPRVQQKAGHFLVC
jgi:hypothetical protein